MTDPRGIPHIKFYKVNKVTELLCFLSGHKSLVLWIFPHTSNPEQLYYVLRDKLCLPWGPKHFEKSAINEQVQIITQKRLFKRLYSAFFSLWYLIAIAADQRNSADETKDQWLWAVDLCQNRRLLESEVPKPRGSITLDLTFTEFPDSCETKKTNQQKTMRSFIATQ